VLCVLCAQGTGASLLCSIVLCIGPYSCLFLRILSAYAYWGVKLVTLL
jgi:hypothetical protein